MPKKLPVISGKKLISFLGSLNYKIVRQRGSHDPIAKGTLNDILTKIAIWNQIPKDALIEKLKA